MNSMASQLPSLIKTASSPFSLHHPPAPPLPSLPWRGPLAVLNWTPCQTPGTLGPGVRGHVSVSGTPTSLLPFPSSPVLLHLSPLPLSSGTQLTTSCLCLHY